MEPEGFKPSSAFDIKRINKENNKAVQLYLTKYISKNKDEFEYPVETAFLNQTELNTIQNKEFTVERLNMVRDLFIFSCYTGLSFIDLMNLKEGNITPGEDGSYMSNVLIPLADRDKRNSLSWFFRRTLPFGATHYPMELTNGRVLKAMYITSAQFDQDGQLFIDDLNKGKLKSKNGMTGYDHHDLIQLLKEKEFKNEVKIIEKFYTYKPEKKKAVKPAEEISRDVLPDWNSETPEDIF
ncbi:MAG TPA: hypothetical protein VIL78_20840 [Hanamia sp.]